MQQVENLLTLIPYGTDLLRKAEDGLTYSKDISLQIYNQTKQKMLQTKQNYFLFQHKLQNIIYNIIQQLVNQILGRTQKLLNISTTDKNNSDLKLSPKRIQIISSIIFNQYLLTSPIITNLYSQYLIKYCKNLGIQYIIPFYISLRATINVLWTMLLQFLQNRFQAMKLTCTSSKDQVIMFVSGNFNQENLKQKVAEGIDLFKKFPVKVVNKGLEIRVDRESLMENYDKFAVTILQLMKQVREKGQDNIHSLKKKSKDLYKEVIKKIRNKQQEIKIQMTTQYPQLVPPPTK